MRKQVIARVILVVCLFSALALSAQNQSYFLRSEGAVSVNGIAVPSTALVSAGDVIQTGKGSSAKIAAPGMAMLLGENSRVSVANGKLAIDQGWASIASTGRIATVSSQYAIQPLSTNAARYSVSNTKGFLSVASASGALAVVGPDTAAKNVLAGQKASFTAGSDTVISGAADSSSDQPFDQLIGEPASHVCRTAASCHCKTAAHCRH